MKPVYDETFFVGLYHGIYRNLSETAGLATDWVPLWYMYNPICHDLTCAEEITINRILYMLYLWIYYSDLYIYILFWIHIRSPPHSGQGVIWVGACCVVIYRKGPYSLCYHLSEPTIPFSWASQRVHCGWSDHVLDKRSHRLPKSFQPVRGLYAF